ncbi:MAG TPA: SemiSWEET family transporter [Candidatus Krumholzibacteria bacterium]|nr:SemiSWEET family transporter [Candidatus Krumholzibacteria bacterium]
MISNAPNSEIVGFVAGFGTTFAAMPDLVRMLRQQSTRGMNPTMPAVMCVFQVVWLYYGVLIGSRPIIVWNVIAVVVNAVSVAAFMFFARREKKP